jgi:VanZ family protein
VAERFEARVWLPALWAGSLLSVVLASLWPEVGRADTAMETQWWNVGHVPAYGALTLLTLVVAGRRFPLSSGRSLGLALGLALLGMLLEVLQPYFGRTADVLDAIHNFFGVLLALGVFYVSRWCQGVYRGAD